MMIRFQDTQIQRPGSCLEEEGKLSLHRLLIKHPAATFFVRAANDSMSGAGIKAGDILIVDRSLEPQNGDLVVAVLLGELSVRRLRKVAEKLFLIAESEKYPSIEIKRSNDLVIWGVVTSFIHQFR